MIDHMSSFLVSPCCKADLNGLDCSNCGRSFFLIQGIPVLVDFTKSILVEDDFAARTGASPVERVPQSPDEIDNSGNPVARRNVARMLQELKPYARVLVVGGATVGRGTGDLYRSDSEVLGLDIYVSDWVNVVADAHQIPFRDETFDAVVVQAVLEHVLSPDLVVGEIWRVLKADGLVYAETPFLQQVHEGPYDFTRFTESGHRWLFRNFGCLDSGVVAGPGTVLQWSIDYMLRGLFRSKDVGVKSRRLTSLLRRLDSRVGADFASDSASCVYFLGRKSNNSLSPQDIVSYYKGAISSESEVNPGVKRE